MRTGTGFLAALLLAGCVSAPPPPPRTWPPGPLQADEQKLLGLHDQIWGLIGLSEGGALELNTLVLELRRNIKYNPNRKGELDALIIPGNYQGKSLTREQFFENHRKRFNLLGISAGTQSELLEAMASVWEALHNPDAPASVRARAERIEDLMRPGLPPCQDDKIMEYRHGTLKRK